MPLRVFFRDNKGRINSIVAQSLPSSSLDEYVFQSSSGRLYKIKKEDLLKQSLHKGSFELRSLASPKTCLELGMKVKIVLALGVCVEGLVVSVNTSSVNLDTSSGVINIRLPEISRIVPLKEVE